MGALKEKQSDNGDDRVFTGWEVDTKLHGQWVLAILAALVSVVIHVGVAWVGSRVDFSHVMSAAYDTPPRRFEAMAIDSVELPEDRQPTFESLRPLQPTTGVDMDSPISRLQVPADAAAIEPPAMRSPEVEPDLAAFASVASAPLSIPWQPRQEIAAIETKIVAGPDESLPRREIPMLERIPDAPDIVLPIAATEIPAFSDGISRLHAPDISGIPEGMGPLPPPSAILTEASGVGALDGDSVAELFIEDPDAITDADPIEQTLVAEVETFRRPGESHGYFRLRIARVGADVLPVMPKDILFVQDTSATIAERRLHFCREGFRRGFAYVGPQDRFNVATFIDRTTYAFPEWVFRGEETDEAVRQYFTDM